MFLLILFPWRHKLILKGLMASKYSTFLFLGWIIPLNVSVGSDPVTGMNGRFSYKHFPAKAAAIIMLFRVGHQHLYMYNNQQCSLFIPTKESQNKKTRRRQVQHLRVLYYRRKIYSSTGWLAFTKICLKMTLYNKEMNNSKSNMMNDTFLNKRVNCFCSQDLSLSGAQLMILTLSLLPHFKLNSSKSFLHVEPLLSYMLFHNWTVAMGKLWIY